MIHDNVRSDIIAHAKAESPREACGLLVRIGQVVRYIPCRNIADDNDFFVIDPLDYLACDRMGDICAVVHSHPAGLSNPSQADKASCEATSLPWYIYSPLHDEWSYLTPSGYEAPLYGRVWVHRVLDCYTFIRDWHRLEHGIMMPDFERDYLWWENGGNVWLDNFEKAGLRMHKGPPREGCVLLMALGSRVPNHGAILLDGDLLAHHAYNQLSNRSEGWGDMYRKRTTHILRHEKLQ